LQVNTSHKGVGNKVHTLLQTTKTVFTTSWLYVGVAVAVAAIFLVLFSLFDQLLFFSPIVVFYLPEDAIGNFIVSTITAATLGIIVSMNLYALNQRRHHSFSSSSKGKAKITENSTGADVRSSASLFSGFSLSILSTVCAGCSSSLGFILTSLFGTGLGVSVSTILSNHQTSLRLISLVILLWSWYSMSRSILTKGDCPFPSNNSNFTNNDT
jgi:hypothetical protein